MIRQAAFAERGTMRQHPRAVEELRLLIGAAPIGLILTDRRVNAELERRVGERTSEVHHRVGNNFQMISSLIGLQARALAPGAGRDALLECQRRVLAVALVHQELQGSRDLARGAFSEYVRHLARAVFDASDGAGRGIRLELDVEDVALAAEVAVPCGLILNELVTNALKHAFPGGRAGTVRVELRRLEGGATALAVIDDGTGIGSGEGVPQASSLGLGLVHMLARQLEARLDVEQAGGTRVRLTLPPAR